jgi:hypothetical protein
MARAGIARRAPSLFLVPIAGSAVQAGKYRELK